MSSDKYHKNIAAIIEAPHGRIEIKAREIPTPGPHEILVRNHAIAANPVDWKIQEYDFYVEKYPTVLGSDGCGVVTAVGSEVSKFQVGDHVTGYGSVIYDSDINHGSWQTYTILRDIAVTKIPKSMSFEEGSVFPMAMATSAIALFCDLGLPRPNGSSSNLESSILIWGGASSVGISAIQLARNLGMKVFTTASPTHHEYLKHLGAFEVFDYHEANVVDKIIGAAKSAGSPIKYAFDTITEDTWKHTLAVLVASGGKGSKLSLTLGWPEDEQKPEGIEIIQTQAYRTGTDQAELGKWFFNEYLETALENGSIVPAPKIEIVPGGIHAAQEVFDKLKAGVSGKKLVVQIECAHN